MINIKIKIRVKKIKKKIVLHKKIYRSIINKKKLHIGIYSTDFF